MIKTKTRFLDPLEILVYANLEKGMKVADFGCGNGFYALAASKIVGGNGIVYAVDSRQEALEATISAAKHAKVQNIYTIQHDLLTHGIPIDDGSCDAVILEKVINMGKVRGNLLRETYRVLKSGGKAIVIEWSKHHLPIGPKVQDRLEPHHINDLLAQSGFQLKHEMPADNYHHALVYVK